MKYQDEYDRYRKMLPVMKHRLDDELELHAQVYEIIASRVVLLNSQMLEAKNALNQREGRIAETIRDEHEKLTKDAVESKVLSHRDRIEAWDRYQEARSEHEMWSGLLDAWRQKGYSIKTLAELYTADYYSLMTSAGGGRTPDYDRERLNRRPDPPSIVRRDQELDEGRAAIRRASNQRESTPQPTNTEGTRARRRSLINE